MDVKWQPTSCIRQLSACQLRCPGGSQERDQWGLSSRTTKRDSGMLLLRTRSQWYPPQSHTALWEVQMLLLDSVGAEGEGLNAQAVSLEGQSSSRVSNLGIYV